MDALLLSKSFIESLLNLHVTPLEQHTALEKFATRYIFTQHQKSFQPPEVGRILDALPQSSICEITDMFGVYCTYVVLKDKIVAIGPYCVEALSLKACEIQLADCGIPTGEAAAYHMYRSSFPVVKSAGVDVAVRTLLKAVAGTDSFARIERVDLDAQTERSLEQNAEPAFAEGRKRFMALIDSRYALEQKLMDAVTQGNSAQALLFFQDLNRSMAQLNYIPNSLSNAKVGTAISRTLLRVAAARSSVSPFELDTLATEYAQRIDRAQSIEAVNHITEQMVIDFCGIVRRAKNRKYSPVIRKALEYITVNMAQQIQVQQLAEELNISPNYLSSVFKKETGETIISYTQRIRCEKAAQLLVFSSMSVQSIASQVGFWDCNYFTKIFKQFYGAVPTQYRRDFGYLSS